ncbi:MAG: glutathione S-transferase family protein [Hyphomicrobiales bacterium]|nr:glutathione S-transferase family protein [Hyphomicrobiales bacterium]
MLTLGVFPAAMGVRNPSSFCLKAEVLLDMSGLDYRIAIMDPRKAPKGKLPVLVDGDETIADSGFIQRHLEQKYGIDFDPGLSDAEKTRAVAYRRMAEEHLYWAVVYSRWIVPENAARTREAFFGIVPAPLRSIVFSMVQRKVRRDLIGQGIGRHDPEDIYREAITDLEAIVAELGDKPYFFGDQPTSIDAALFGLLENLVVPPTPSPLRDAALDHPEIADYCDRMRARFPARG